MVRTRSASMAKGKAKLCQPPTRASSRLATLRSNTVVQIPTPTPDVPVKETVTSTLSPKKRQNFRMPGESSSRKDTKTPCRRSRRLAALYSVTKPVSEEKVVIEISDDSVQKEDTNLEQNEAEPVAEVVGGVDLPKNDVYDALWAMLDVESDNEAEEMPGEWDLDSTLLNWGRNQSDVDDAPARGGDFLSGSTHIWSRCCLEFVTQPPAPKSNPLSPVQSCCHQDLLRMTKFGASDLCPGLTNSIGSPLSPGQTCCHQVPKHLCHVAVANLVRSRNCH
ncbi:hypothetical protein PIB30_066004 [Stylosanthes scabra]|uniref:Uncharacterized protein n=1 Tax=Stylosanthes scabra TaxID=79078 RepID=A0ABU6TM17_9FABA|nr:hypothetical protein [Stylosanthes scabra]